MKPVRGGGEVPLAMEVLRASFWKWYDHLGAHVLGNLKVGGSWFAGAAALVWLGVPGPLGILLQSLWFSACAGAAAGAPVSRITRAAAWAVLGAGAVFVTALSGVFYSRAMGGGLPGGAALGLGLSGSVVAAAASVYAPGASALGAGGLGICRFSLAAAAAHPWSSMTLFVAQAVLALTVLIPIAGFGLGFSLSGTLARYSAERAASRLGLTFPGSEPQEVLREALRQESSRGLRDLMRPWEQK